MLAGALRERVALVVRRCHVGLDEHNEWTREAWGFLRELVEPAQVCVFSREAFAPDWVDRRWLRLISPSAGPVQPEDADLRAEEVEVLVHREGPWSRACRAHRRVVLQVSRWDRLKDMGGVLAGFGEHIRTSRPTSTSCWRAPRPTA